MSECLFFFRSRHYKYCQNARDPSKWFINHVTVEDVLKLEYAIAFARYCYALLCFTIKHSIHFSVVSAYMAHFYKLIHTYNSFIRKFVRNVRMPLRMRCHRYRRNSAHRRVARRCNATAREPHAEVNSMSAMYRHRYAHVLFLISAPNTFVSHATVRERLHCAESPLRHFCSWWQIKTTMTATNGERLQSSGSRVFVECLFVFRSSSRVSSAVRCDATVCCAVCDGADVWRPVFSHTINARQMDALTLWMCCHIRLRAATFCFWDDRTMVPACASSRSIAQSKLHLHANLWRNYETQTTATSSSCDTSDVQKQ